jgi:hypothetical protein
MSGPKARLTVTLKADETVVAVIENADLWQRILAIINKGAKSGLTDPASDEAQEQEALEEDGDGDGNANASVARFAKSLGIQAKYVVSALSPSSKSPYLTLDHHAWAAMKKGVPNRGPGSLSTTGLAATLLALWAKEARLSISVTQALAAEVLQSVNVVDKNPSRGIKNTKWLQPRAGGVVVLNAAEISHAQKLAASFCTKSWSTAKASQDE